MRILIQRSARHRRWAGVTVFASMLVALLWANRGETPTVTPLQLDPPAAIHAPFAVQSSADPAVVSPLLRGVATDEAAKSPDHNASRHVFRGAPSLGAALVKRRGGKLPAGRLTDACTCEQTRRVPYGTLGSAAPEGGK